MKKVAIIVDGQFLMHRIKEAKNVRDYPSAEEINLYLNNLINDDEEIYRIFFYQGEHSKQKTKTPISKVDIDFKDSEIATYSTELLLNLSKKQLMAVRVGDTRFRGWKLRTKILNKLTSGTFTEVLTDDHFTPDFQQKGVDIKIGLDVAWLASNNLVDRIILVTGDSDFIPAMKFARREGLQVILLKIGNKYTHESLEIHSDFIRSHSNEKVVSILNAE